MSFQKFTDALLAKIGVSSFAIAVYFLTPNALSIVSVIFVLISYGVILFLQSRWVESNADQWLLIIRDGKLVKAGIGLQTLSGFSDTVVKFPSKIEKVTFSANNVTKEMQGVNITGFAFWSVYREDDGPFRCYKYMQGNDANSNVRAMCESVVRSQIANSSLEEVLRNRHSIRDAVKKELKDQFKGWGVWLETVQITEVLISSNKLFTDLQADFRQQTRLQAEKIELSNNEKITQARQTSNTKIAEITNNTRTKKESISNEQNLKKKQIEANFQLKQSQLAMKRMTREKTISLQEEKNTHLINQENLKKTQLLEKIRKDFEIQSAKKSLEVYKFHNERTLEKYEIDSLARIYERQQLRGVTINQYSSNDKEAIAAIMPALGFGAAQIRS